MTGHDYEYVVADWLRKNGYHSVKVTQASGDYGIDVLANKGGYSYAIQCKYYTGAVGVSAVQEAAAGRGYYRCDRAMVVTNSTFTKAAKELASANGVILVEGISKSGHWMPRLGNTPGCLWLCLFPFVWLTCWMFHLFIDLLRICWDGLVYAVSEWLAALKHEEQHGNLEQCEPLFDCEQPCDTGVVDEFESCEAEYDTIRETAPTTLIHQQGPYTKPPFTLLHPPEYTASVAHNVVRKRDALRESISLWGYPVTSVDVSVGRAYTQYRITTEKVIQFSRFIRHHDEISFILGVNDVRITGLFLL